MILSAQSIRALCGPGGMIMPFRERTEASGMTFGLSAAGYDVRIRETVELWPGDFALASTIERFRIPTDLVALVKDKSTWARRGITVQNTVAEPGWHGYLTLELTNHGPSPVVILEGSPIAQIIFQRLDEPTEQPYRGRYQNQPSGPVAAKLGAPDAVKAETKS